MLTRAQIVALRVAFVVGGSIVGFVLCESRYRSVETWVSIHVVNLMAGGHHASRAGHASIEVVSLHHAAFIAVITPSCSATASILAIACLSSLSPRYGLVRRVLATGIALFTVAAVNVMRISLSVLVGVHDGVSSLVLFHNWVGGVMTFVYTLGGYVLLLYILLPDRPGEPARAGSELTTAS